MDTTAAEKISSEVLGKLEMLANSLGVAVENLYSVVVEDMVRSNMLQGYICLGIFLLTTGVLLTLLVRTSRGWEQHSEEWQIFHVFTMVAFGLMAIPSVIVMVRAFSRAARPHAEALELFKGLF